MKFRESKRTWGCNKPFAIIHPWHEHIRDAACGYDDRMGDVRCDGCWRRRTQGAHEQLREYYASQKVG